MPRAGAATRRIPIHTKLAAALALPLIALVAVAVIEAVHSVRDADEVRRQVSLVKAATGPGGLFNALQDERNRALIDLLGQESLIELPVADNVAARRGTDAALRQFAAGINAESEQVQYAYAAAFVSLEQLAGLRAAIDSDEGPFDLTNIDTALGVFGRYTAMIDVLLEANARVALAIDNGELRRGADLSYLASRQTDLIARLVTTLLFASVTPGGLDAPDEIAQVAALHGLAVSGTDAIESLAVGDYAGIGATLLAQHRALGLLDRVVPKTLETGDVDVTALLDAVSVPRDESYYGFRTNVKRILEREADARSALADRRARMFQLVAALVVLGAALAAWAVSRSITRPLSALTWQARDMANRRLPTAVAEIVDTPLGVDVVLPEVPPVSVGTRDEIADVAAALSSVQYSALDLALEQAILRRNIADSFVNLGRRSQSLLDRQLEFITGLESEETDPDVLAALYRLDHLATRMRRNAESLLVLAGVDPSRHRTTPVRVHDVIRAALGEVEDYGRVTIRAVDSVIILGSAVSDVVHLLAELVENALSFSSPDQTVEVQGRARAGGYIITVLDAGLGMLPDDVALANRRLAGAEAFTIAPSKYLGHYVAGHLAARHDIELTLHGTPGYGITAAVVLPSSVLASGFAALPAGSDVPA